MSIIREKRENHLKYFQIMSLRISLSNSKQELVDDSVNIPAHTVSDGCENMSAHTVSDSCVNMFVHTVTNACMNMSAHSP